MDLDDHWWTRQQVSWNGETAENWELFSNHRQEVTQRIVSLAPADSRGHLAVVGAGNCNDIDLNHLVDHFSEIHLFDLDTEAIKRGVERQRVTDRDRLHISQPIDLSGFQAVVPSGAASTASIPPLALLDALGQPIEMPATGFDVVASTGLLSQLILAGVRMGVPNDPRLPEVLAAIRTRHFFTLLEMLVPGGRALVTFETTSSLTLKGLLTCTDDRLPGLLREALDQGDFFSGLHPAAVLNTVQNVQSANCRFQSIQPLRPWTWNLGPRTYAVCGLIVTSDETNGRG